MIKLKETECNRAMRLEWIERCCNCRWFVECNKVAQFDPCPDYWQVDERQMVVVIEAGEHERLKTIENLMRQLQW
jgi:hypothetical protein